MKTVSIQKRFYKDPQNAKVSGVCAGLARYFDINVWLVRVAAIAAFITVPFVTGLAYIIAVVLLEDQ